MVVDRPSLWILLWELTFLNCLMAQDFPVYWNMPADACAQWGYDYTTVKWKFVKNINNAFFGEQITIFYNAGSFPRIDGFSNNSDYTIVTIRNKGVPQAGSMKFHISALKEEINRIMPDRKNKGLAVIDMEDWYPRWALNSGFKNIYRLHSRKLVFDANPSFKTWEVEKEAIESFHEYAEKFLMNTIKVAKLMRPNAVWGYYEFPYCDNYDVTSDNRMDCSSNVRDENEKYLWIYNEMDALYPYIYLYNHYDEALRAKHIIGRLEETYRVLRVRNITRKVYPYANPMLINGDTYLSRDDILSSLLIPKVCGTEGVIVWGSSSFFNSSDKCAAFDNYLKNTLGPAVDFAATCSMRAAKQWLKRRGERDEICK